MEATALNKPQMNADERKYLHSELTEQIIGSFYEVYNELGYGFRESVYEVTLCKLLSGKGLCPQRQVATPVWFRGEKISDFYADLLVNN
jgi:GxxExxY protein